MQTSKDIYDGHGRLLVAQGHEISDRTKEKLKLYRVLEKEEFRLDDSANIDKMDLCRRLNLESTSALDYPTGIISEILFDSRKQPWWFVINTLVNYIDWVYTHSINVALISLLIAMRAGASEKCLQEIALGCALHDVGKLMIPKMIIQKNAALDDHEMILMKQHCEVGVSLTSGFELPDSCTAIILQHHERNNGSGYPYGLKSNEIHPYAKVAMLADVLDAITSYRPYRPAKTMEEAFAYFRSTKDMYSEDVISAAEEIFLS